MQEFIRDRESYLVLQTIYVNNFLISDTSPTVLNCLVHKFQNTGAVSVTNFDDGTSGQTIRVKGDGFTTVKNNSFIKTNTGADKLLASNKIYSFTLIEDVWYEAE